MLHQSFTRCVTGEVVLYKRTRSRVWQCTYKLFAGQWVRISTGKSVLEHAVRVASDMYDEARLYSLRHTYPTQELLSGTDIHTLTKQMGKSVRMLAGLTIFSNRPLITRLKSV